MPPKQDLELSDDDFDEILSDGDEDVKPDKNNIHAVLKGSLSKPRHTQVSTKTLHDYIHMGSIDLDAEYQRDVVWPESKMIGLIGSIFMNYYIPPLIFAVITDDEGGERRLCIDGKQRCTSILNFMDGKIPFMSAGTRTKYWYTNPGSRRYGQALPAGLRARFDLIQIQAVEYEGIGDTQQRDIFQRVQMGVALSAPEKLQAIPGPWSAWIITLLKKYVAEEKTLGELITWDQARGRPFQALTAIIMLAIDDDRAATPTAAGMTKFLSRSDPPDVNFKRKIEKALAEFVNIATNHYDTAFKSVPGKTKIAPVEFWFIALLLYSRMSYYSVASLAQKIGEMRKYIRGIYIDIRANGRTIKDLHDWLSKVPKKRPANEIPAAEDYEEEVDEREQRVLKRSRKGEDQDPTYRDTIIPREIVASDATIATRSRPIAGRTSPKKKVSTPISRQSLPTQQAVRPPSTSMDRPPQPIHLSSSLAPMTHNPYTNGYGQPAMQQQNVPQARSPVYATQQQPNYQYQGQPQPNARYAPADAAHFASIAEAQAKQREQQLLQSQGSRWASR